MRTVHAVECPNTDRIDCRWCADRFVWSPVVATNGTSTSILLLDGHRSSLRNNTFRVKPMNVKISCCSTTVAVVHYPSPHPRRQRLFLKKMKKEQTKWHERYKGKTDNTQKARPTYAYAYAHIYNQNKKRFLILSLVGLI